MRLYLCGQRSFGAAALQLLLREGHEVAGVSAPAKSDDGREDRLWGMAGDLDLPRMPAGELSAYNVPDGLDVIVCAHSYDFVGRKTRLRTKLGAIGYHPSILPLHRGRDAVRWTIRMGDRITGGSVYWLSDTVDGGPIAAQKFCLVRPGMTASDLWREELFPIGIELLGKVLRDLSSGTVVAVPQDEELATWEPSFGRPPLHRPDLPMLCQVNNDETRSVVTDRSAAQVS